jgi:hypothetical protein
MNGFSFDTSQVWEVYIGVSTRPPPQGKAVRAMRLKYPAYGLKLSQPASGSGGDFYNPHGEWLHFGCCCG